MRGLRIIYSFKTVTVYLESIQSHGVPHVHFFQKELIDVSSSKSLVSQKVRFYTTNRFLFYFGVRFGARWRPANYVATYEETQ